jgi:hypothetical protein
MQLLVSGGMTMPEFKHIKGPWTCDHFRDRSLIHKYRDHELHEDCKGDLLLAKVTGVGEIREATANLIAAAPELLDCVLAMEEVDDHCVDCETCEDMMPELCEEGFPLADKARLMRRAVLEKLGFDVYQKG